ncbi:hypothetical protein [Cellulomonas sp. Leaf395]|uniref:hypothetical protein n=1 Tax=Cellulomonas sp. Leaf395 TaxID=1736362 RepID=UPI0006FF8C04|nr:hypothetical protein [Cellulomonas sp. Leaf395]KQS99544.1 hypothetical protein ASG23_09215 [Cellulomonas sp. Leaf395]
MLGVVAVSSALLLSLGAGAAHATGGGDGEQTPQPSLSAKQETTAAYVYRKKDLGKDAAWRNSTQQYLAATWPGGSWRDDLTLAEIQAALPAGVTLCGEGWGIQQDKAYGDETVFTESAAPLYPDNFIGWWDEETQAGAIFDAEHWELSEVVTQTVPECGSTSTPTPSQSVPASTPSETSTATPTPVAQVADDPAPASTPTPTAVVLALTPTPSATVYSQVLATGDTGGAALAATGSSPLPDILAGGILVLSGAALLLARRLRSS